MALLRDLITEMREELTDAATPPRFSDAQYLRALGKAARRVQTLLHRHNIELGRSLYVFETEPGLDTYFLPGDYQTAEGLYWPGVREIPMALETAFESGPPQPELTRYLVREDTLVLQGVPSRTVELHLAYWPSIDTAAWTLDDATPWGGKLDDLLVEYGCLRLRNVDEEDVSLDLQLRAELESDLLTMFVTRSATAGRVPGWI